MSEEAVKSLFNYGVPTGILLFVALGAWRILWAVGSFLAPLVSDLFNAARMFLETNVKFLQKMEVLGDGLLHQQQVQTALMERQDEKIDAIHRLVMKP